MTVPAEVLRFLEVTDVEPRWLLHGEGPMRRDPAASAGAAPGPTGAPPSSLESLASELLRRLARGRLRVEWEWTAGEGPAGPAVG